MKKKFGRDAEIMKLRGLGFEQNEIAKKLGMSQASVSYELDRLRERVKAEGVDNVFLELVMKLYLPKLLRWFDAR